MFNADRRSNHVVANIAKNWNNYNPNFMVSDDRFLKIKKIVCMVNGHSSIMTKRKLFQILWSMTVRFEYYTVSFR
jgi:hypothetical protein